jgi:HIP---CoA ligase
MPSDPQTIPAVLDRIAHELPDHYGLITPDRSLTFSSLRDEARRAAAAMISLGVRTDDRVAIWSPNTWHWVVACLATHYAGAAVVPLNTRYTATEATDILARTRTPLLIAMGEFLGADKLTNLDRSTLPDLRHIVRVPVDADDGTWDEFVSRGSALEDQAAADARAAAIQPEDVSDILFTSGTTGRSKGDYARTGSRWPVRRRGPPVARSPATTATCASTRSSTTLATRPGSSRACRRAQR